MHKYCGGQERGEGCDANLSTEQTISGKILTSLCVFSPSIMCLLPVSEQANVPICDVTKGSNTGEFIQVTLHPVFHFDGPFKVLWMVQ